MGPATGIVLPVALLAVAYLLGRRELRLYRTRDEVGSDLFLYTRGRLVRRMTGLGLVVAIAVVLFAMEYLVFGSAGLWTVYAAVLTTCAFGLVILPILDLVETARTANSADLRRQDGRRRD